METLSSAMSISSPYWPLPPGLLSKWKPKSFGIVLFATKVGGRVRLGLSNHASSQHENFHMAVWVVSLVPGKISWPGCAEYISLR
jgi:hypothetical protein